MVEAEVLVGTKGSIRRAVNARLLGTPGSQASGMCSKRFTRNLGRPFVLCLMIGKRGAKNLRVMYVRSRTYKTIRTSDSKCSRAKSGTTETSPKTEWVSYESNSTNDVWGTVPEMGGTQIREGRNS